jgi:hypothetical protein
VIRSSAEHGIDWQQSECYSRALIVKPTATLSAAPVLLSCLFLILCVFAAISILAPKHMDFAVYWYDIHAFLYSGLPLYGPHSALGFPMLFRYPPTFVDLFYPLSLLSFKAAGCLWAIAEAFAVTIVTYWAYVRLRLTIGLTAGLMALAISAPYCYLSFKDGNMQWLVTVLVLASVLTAETNPWLAGFTLSLGIAIKIWPIVFLPMFLIRQRRNVLWATICWSVAIWAIPLLTFGPSGYGQLLQDWFHQEFANHMGVHDIWYPSQSLRGVLLRFFTDPASTLPYRSEFPDVHLLALPPGLLIAIWSVTALAASIYVTRQIWVSYGLKRTQWDLLYFVLFSAFQPFCNWSSLISLMPAVLMAAHINSNEGGIGSRINRIFFTVTVVLCGVEYAASLSRANTRLFEALGLHLAIMLSVAVALWPTLETKSQAKFYCSRTASLEERR